MIPFTLRGAFGPVHSSFEIVLSFSSIAQTEPGDTHEAAWREHQRRNKTFRLNTWSSDNLMWVPGGGISQVHLPQMWMCTTRAN